MRDAAHSYACPALCDFNKDGLLDLAVGEKTAGSKGKIRMYLNRGTPSCPVFDDFVYLRKGGKDVEFEGQGCIGAQVAFGMFPSLTLVAATSQGEILALGLQGGFPPALGDAEWEKWFGHATDRRFANLIRAHAFCCDVDGDGRTDVVVSGQNSPMFWIRRTGEGESAASECNAFVDENGECLRFPENQNHTSAVMADLDADGLADIVTGDTRGDVWVYFAKGALRFASAPVRIYENPDAENKRARLAVGDLDGDGAADLLAGRQDGSVLFLKGGKPMPAAMR